MRAAVLEQAPGELVITDLTIDKPGPGEVLVRTVAAGLCHSDLHFVEALWPAPCPAVLGHESAGVVEAVGPDVTYVQPGDHVITCLSAYCGSCDYCLTGRLYLCSDRGALERPAGAPPRLSRNGELVNQFFRLSSFAEQMLVHQHAVVRITKDMPLDRAALIGCGVTTGVGAVFRTAKVEPGATVAVIGCGGIGLNCIQGARIAGAGRIIAIDLNPAKLELAKQFGATDVVDMRRHSTPAERIAAVKKLTDDWGGDVVLELVGHPGVVDEGLRMTAPEGTYLEIGNINVGWKAEFDPSWIIFGNRRIIGLAHYEAEHLRGALDLMRRTLTKYPWGSVVSHKFPLEQINEAFIEQDKGHVTRAAIVPN
jgi:S-(hydroxymethyl)glutathione dehydrogenase/alcohol dehydrogenase